MEHPRIEFDYMLRSAEIFQTSTPEEMSLFDPPSDTGDVA
jgi:hypothetical protein